MVDRVSGQWFTHVAVDDDGLYAELFDVDGVHNLDAGMECLELYLNGLLFTFLFTNHE